MTDLNANFVDAERVRQYIVNGPPAFTPGHAALMQMIGILLGEHVPANATVLVIGAGGGLETRYLASVGPEWHFVGVDPAAAMLHLARATADEAAGDRLTLIEGTVRDAPPGPYDAATCILVLGLVADDGGKLELLRGARSRLKPGAPFILVDQCIDRSAPDVDLRLDRYAAYARRSGVSDDIVAKARAGLAALETMVPAARNIELLEQAGFRDVDLFYLAMAWRGWVALA